MYRHLKELPVGVCVILSVWKAGVKVALRNKDSLICHGILQNCSVLICDNHTFQLCHSLVAHSNQSWSSISLL